MPEISRFYGIRITMNSNDHQPPHFHAEHGDDEASVDIRTGQLLAGQLSSRAFRLVQEWWALHQGELAENWARRERQEPLFRIAPL
jgi:hypothetical protein